MMNIHEYQAKEIFRQFNVPVLAGKTAQTIDDAIEAVKELNGGNIHVVKAQIKAGGRGKAGGIVLVKSQDELRTAVTSLLYKKLVTAQTGPDGEEVKTLYIEKGAAIQKEYYLSVVLDTNNNGITFIASAEGGMDIESLAGTDKIQQVTVNPLLGLQPFHIRSITYALGLNKNQGAKLTPIIKNLYNIFLKTDAQLIEINPLILTVDDEWIALDAKMSFDDNALFRRQEIAAMQEEESTVIEEEAKKHELNYVKLDGSIGCMVNGAGLAMATMDIIKLHGGEPANFLDVGGGATKEKVAAAFKLIMADPNVNAILVNIFGGIMRCDVIAEGILSAAQQVSLSIPLVVRLQGTNKELGQKMLAESGLKIIATDDLEEAAKTVVKVSKEK